MIINHVTKKFRTFFRFFLILVGMILFFSTYFAVLNYLQIKIESHQLSSKNFISRESLAEKAKEFAWDSQLIPKDHMVWIRNATPFSDAAAVDYLSHKQFDSVRPEVFPWKRVFGLQDLHDLPKQDDLWYWSFKVVDSEGSRKGGYVVDISASSGEVIGFSRYGWDPDKNHLEEMATEQKRVIAYDFLHSIKMDADIIPAEDMQETDQIENCSSFQVLENSSKGILFEKKKTVRVCGQRVEEYRSNFFLPSNGNQLNTLSTIARVFFFGLFPLVLVFLKSFILVLGFGIYLVMQKIKRQSFYVDWRKTTLFGMMLFSLLFIKEFFDRFGVLFYNKTISLNELARTLQDALGSTFFTGVISLILPPIIALVIGRRLSLMYFPDSLKTFDMFFNGQWGDRRLFLAIIRGGVLFIVLLLVQCLVIFIGGLLFGSWSDVRNPLSTLVSPFHLFSSDIGYDTGIFASFNEEILFRLLLISFLFSRYKKLSTAIILASVIWTLLHVTLIYHPFYVQQFNLLLNGIILGFVFVRYGLFETIVAHFFFNVAAFIIPISLITTPFELAILIFATVFPVLLPILVYLIRKLGDNSTTKYGSLI